MATQDRNHDKDVERKLKSKTEKAMAAAGESFDDLREEIREDFDSLKGNVVGIARNLRDVSAESARAASDYAAARVDDLREASADTMKKMEGRIKSRPGQSVALAFAAGVVASYLLGRRSS